MKPVIVISLLLVLAACNSGNKSDVSTDSANQSDTNNMVKPVDDILPVQLAADQVPRSIRFAGKLSAAWQWNDQMGENILVTSVVAPYNDKQKNEYDEEGQTSVLHAFHFIKKDTTYQLLWKISDGEKACPFDITTDFIKNATTITDLDRDGIAETTIQYKLACRSDVSPAYMKVIMHEDTTKYGLRGLMWIQAGEDKFTVTESDMNLEKLPAVKDEYKDYLQKFGRYETEKEFVNAPPIFLEHAKSQWWKFVKETFE